jgi:hypothetical protein
MLEQQLPSPGVVRVVLDDSARYTANQEPLPLNVVLDWLAQSVALDESREPPAQLLASAST